jgi:hypothetical protein
MASIPPKLSGFHWLKNIDLIIYNILTQHSESTLKEIAFILISMNPLLGLTNLQMVNHIQLLRSKSWVSTQNVDTYQ